MKHALLNASSSKRWLACPPSARQEAKKENKSNSYADEGSFAHEVADNELKFKLRQITNEDYMKSIDGFRNNTLYEQSLKDYVSQYVSLVMEKVNEARARGGHVEALTEQRYDFTNYVPEGFGTSDATIISDGILEIVDLKYGVGVKVSAYDNPQMRLYALGALSAFDCIYDIHTVKMTIAQIRCDFVTTETLTVEELKRWGEEEVKPKAALAYEGKGEYCPGDHCQFCRIKSECRARAEKNLEMANYEFQDPALLSREDINAILQTVEELKAWAKDIWEYVSDQAINHEIRWDGFKVVRGKSNRAYTDFNEIERILLAKGFKKKEIQTEPELKGITAMEKLLGKKKFTELLGEYIHKPEGKPTLVKADDPRPEIGGAESAKMDFDDDFLV